MLDINYILEENGVDIRKYRAILINNDRLKGGQVQITDKDGNIVSCDDIKVKPIAENSQFYNKIMDDGVVFNPYIHRRFIASQFLDMMRSDRNVDRVIKFRYSYEYSIEYTKKELHKLAFEMDDNAFEERKMFFSKERISRIFKDHVMELKDYLINRCNSWTDREGYAYIGGSRYYISYSKLFGRFLPLQLIQDLTETAITLSYTSSRYDDREQYKDLYKTIKEIPTFIFERTGGLSPMFIDAFKASGVFYTFKQLVLFEHCIYFSVNDPEEIMKILTNKVKAGLETYKMYGILKDMIAKNNYIL